MLSKRQNNIPHWAVLILSKSNRVDFSNTQKAISGRKQLEVPESAAPINNK